MPLSSYVEPEDPKLTISISSSRDDAGRREDPRGTDALFFGIWRDRRGDLIP